MFHIYINRRQKTTQMKPLPHVKRKKIKSWNKKDDVQLLKFCNNCAHECLLIKC